MPRPRSSTFYLPLAPIDAPLELKAKLSVLPPSAANALLAPRTSFSRPHPHPYQQGGSSANANGSSCTLILPKEDECTRLNRVLGIPSHNATSLGVPSSGPIGTAGRRRHTDAPKPSFPLTRSPRSPALTPAPAPARTPSTDWAVDYSMPKTNNNSATGAAINNTPILLATQPTTTTELLLPMANPISEAESESDEAINDPDTPHSTLHRALPLWLSGSQATIASIRVAEQDDGYDPACRRLRRPREVVDTTKSMAWASSTQDDVEMSRRAHSADDMDMFAGACDVQNPVVHGRLQSPTPTSRPSTAACASPVLRVQTPIAPIPEESSSTTTEAVVVYTRTPLSGVPCGALQVWACRSKIPSRLCEDFSDESSCSSLHTTASSSSSLFSLSSLASSSSDSLHPLDTRHLLRKEFRLSFPPPPAPLPCSAVRDLHPREEACLFVDESIPGLVLADIQASFPAAPQPTPAPAAPAKQAPRQRFRLAPLYLPKVLRRSLGATTWARAETLRAARAAERGFGCGAGGLLHAARGIHSVHGGEWAGTGAWIGSASGNAWWGRIPDIGSSSSDGSSSGGSSSASELVWSGYEDLYSGDDDDDDDMDGVELKDLDDDDEDDEDLQEDDEGLEGQRCVWDWDEDEVVEPVRIHGQRLHDHDHDEEPQMQLRDAMEEDVFVREGAPEPEEHLPVQVQIPQGTVPSSTAYSPESSPAYSTPPEGEGTEPLGYSMFGRFDWDSTWPASPTSPGGRDDTTSFSLAQDAGSFSRTSQDAGSSSLAPITIKMPPVTRRAIRREDGDVEAEEEEEEEEIFRYSPLKLEEGQDAQVDMEVEGEEGCQLGDDGHLRTQSMSSCSTPTATSPSFPPGPLRGVAISSSFEDGYLDAMTPEEKEEFFDADGDAAMEDSSPEEQSHNHNVIVSRPHIRAPRPLSLVRYPVLHHRYPVNDTPSPPSNSVFIIPPSPLTNTTFEAGTGSSTPTSATALTFPERMEEEADLANVGWGASTHILSEKRSYERIVAPRPQRPSRGLEQVFNAASPVLRTSSLASPPPSFTSPPPPSSFASPPPTSASPRIPITSSPRIGGKAAWAFGSLKSALSNSMSHLVELARSRSPSPLPWLMRGTASTGATLSGAAAALESARQASEELDSERSTSCVTPTPAAGSHSRRSSTTTITGPTARQADSHLPILKLQVDSASTDATMSESPPPKRTLSTSSLSSLGSEPDSESGSSGGIFSRSPSPEPGSERVWDPSYTLTPRSRPISADAKAAAACGGRLSPMMIPGSWDPEEVWAEDGDLAKTW